MVEILEFDERYLMIVEIWSFDLDFVEGKLL